MTTPSHLPKDLMSQLEDNMKAGRPLLQDAVLYRGTRVPDQTGSSFTPDTMHGSLLPQVAASYTHNWEQKMAFIGTYKVDRENTRFYQDFGLEQHLENKKVPSMSVREAEKFLEPFVRELAAAPDGRSRGQAEERLEAAIKRNLYEANVPSRTAEKAPNRPVDLYIYNGRPDVAVRRAVTASMIKVGPGNEAGVKALLVKEQRNAVIKNIHQLSTHRGPAQEALSVLKGIAQRDYSESVKQHASKPLNKMMDDVAQMPLSPSQERLGRFAKAVVEGMEHPNPAVQLKARAIVSELTMLEKSSPGAGTVRDVSIISSNVAKVFSDNEKAVSAPTAGREASAAPKLDRDTAAPPSKQAVTMDR